MKPQKYLSSPRFISVIASLIILIIGIFLLVIITNNYAENQSLNRRKQVTEDIALYANALTDAISQRSALLSGLKIYIEQNFPDDLNQNQFSIFSAGLYSSVNNIQYFAILPGGVYKFVYPLENHFDLLNVDLFNDPSTQTIFNQNKEISNKDTILSGPVVSSHDTLDLYATKRIDRKGQYWGIVLIKLDLTGILTDTGLQKEASTLQVAMRDSNRRVFYGKPETFNLDPVITRIILPASSWEIAAVPVGGWKQNDPVNNWILSVGIILIAYGMIFVYNLTGSQAKLRQAVNDRTTEIRKELDERKLVEDHLRWVNRSLTSLNICNQLTANANDEIQLLQQICQLLVDSGGYEMVWSGAALADSPQSIYPIASAGNGEGYFLSANFTWRADGVGLGPTGRAIRSGEITVCDDIQNDPTFIYRAEAEALGYSASITLPLKENNETWGNLTAYAGKRGNFDSQEVEILATMAGNLSYAIQSILERQDHAHDEILLQKTEMNYRELADSIGDIFVALNADMVITYCNTKMLEVTGLTEDQVIGQQLETGFKFLPADEFFAQAKNVILTQQNLTFISNPSDQNGEYIYEVNIYPVGEGISVLAKDISDRIFDQRELATYTSRLEGMREIDRQILSAGSPAVISKVAVELLHANIPCDFVAIATADLELNEITIVASKDDTYLDVWHPGDRFSIEYRPEELKSFAEGKPFIITDTESLSSLGNSFQLIEHYGFQSGIISPMMIDNKINGAIILLSKVPHAFKDQDVKIVSEYAMRLAVAFRQAILNEETELRVRRMSALTANNLAITSSLDIGVTLNIILEQISAQGGVDGAIAFLYNKAAGILSGAASHGLTHTHIKRLHFMLGEGIAGQIALDRETVFYADIRQMDNPELRIIKQLDEKIITLVAIPLIAKGQVKGVLELFHRSPLHLNEEWLSFMKTLGTQAAIAIDNAELFDNLQKSNLELSLAYDGAIEGWSRAVELRRQEKSGHTIELADFTIRIARHLGIPDDELADIRRGVLLHDIGMIGISDDILLKPGPLTEMEWEIIREHPHQAYTLLSPIPYLHMSLEIPYGHHEHWDGSGYPQGIAGQQIPLSARIFTIVDIWDSLQSVKPYRPAWNKDDILQYIRDQSGIILDPDIVEQFLQLIP